MIPIAIGLSWLGYSVGFYGYCLIRGYDLSFGNVLSPFRFYTGKWPPEIAPDNVIIPSGTATGKKPLKGGNPPEDGGGGNPLPCPPGFRLVNGRCLAPGQAPGK